MITEDSRPQLAGLAPSPELSVVAIEPPGSEAGTWAGAPSAVRDGDQILLAYRLRRPIGHGRGYAVAIARSGDGVHFETIQVITRDEMDTESLERPALVRTPSGAWRLYVSCATWGTKHWRVELLEASAPDAFDARQRAVVLPGDATTAVKDPVIRHEAGTWHLWASVHPLDDLASSIQQQAARLAEAGRFVDQRLLNPRTARKLAMRYVYYTLHHHIARTIERNRWEPTIGDLVIQVRPGEVGYRQAPLAYAWNELQEMLSVSSPLVIQA